MLKLCLIILPFNIVYTANLMYQVIAQVQFLCHVMLFYSIVLCSPKLHNIPFNLVVLDSVMQVLC